MRVVDQEPYAWFLLEEHGAYFLDANCNHSAIGYTVLIQLNTFELAEYQLAGRAFIGRLAQEIHNSVPILAVSRSPFKGRDLSRTHGERVMAAIKEWRQGSA